MSHQLAYVIVPQDTTPDTVESVVEEILNPYIERWDENDLHSGWWDWWQIGGRFTGALSAYSARTDPRNVETCNLCNGTGTRPDMTIFNGCNGCAGVGQRLKHATEWASFDGDLQPVAKLDDARVPYTVVTPDGDLHVEEFDYHEKRFVQNEHFDDLWRKAVEPYSDHKVVVVDYHS